MSCLSYCKYFMKCVFVLSFHTEDFSVFHYVRFLQSGQI